MFLVRKFLSNVNIYSFITDFNNIDTVADLS